MLRRLILAAGLCMSCLTPAQAVEEEWAIGMAAPEPTGITLKKWVDTQTAYDMFYEWSTKDRHAMVHFDILTHDFDSVETEGSGFAPIYYGFGVHARMMRGRSPIYGIRIPIGIVYMLEDKPLEFFGELGPRAGVIPETSFDLDLMVGIRYRI